MLRTIFFKKERKIEKKHNPVFRDRMHFFLLFFYFAIPSSVQPEYGFFSYYYFSCFHSRIRFFYDFLIPLHQQIKCACVHILALIKLQIHSCACEFTHPNRYSQRQLPESADTKSCEFYPDLIFEIKKQTKGGGGRKKITAQTLQNLS